MDILNQAIALISKFVTVGGGALAVWGIVTIGTNLKDHNGPAISSGVWELVGGALIIAAAQLFSAVIA